MSRLEHIILTSTPSAARTRRAPRPLRVRSSTRIAAWPLLRAHAALPPEWLWRGRKFYMLAGAGAEEDMSGQYFSLLESEWSRRGACTPQLRSSCTVHTPYIHCRSQVTAFQMSSCALLTRASLASLASRLAVMFDDRHMLRVLWKRRCGWHARVMPCGTHENNHARDKGHVR